LTEKNGGSPIPSRKKPPVGVRAQDVEAPRTVSKNTRGAHWANIHLPGGGAKKRKVSQIFGGEGGDEERNRGGERGESRVGKKTSLNFQCYSMKTTPPGKEREIRKNSREGYKKYSAEGKSLNKGVSIKTDKGENYGISCNSRKAKSTYFTRGLVRTSDWPQETWKGKGTTQAYEKAKSGGVGRRRDTERD